MNAQIRNQFDSKTIKKILTGAAIAGTATIALYLLDWIGTLDLDAFTPLVAAIIPIAVNAIKEFKKGE